MDVERSIEHLLKLHARAEQRMDRAEQRMDRAEARMDRTDRQIVAIQKIVKTGMKLIVRIEATQARTDAKIDRLAEMWLKRPPNGNSKR
jgi:ABC-type sugar transport system ATPase subunit